MAEIIKSLKTDWTPEDYYNFEDLNRVEEATALLRESLEAFRGVPIDLNINLNRNLSHIEFASSLNRIENNILQLSQILNRNVEFEEPKTDWVYNSPFDYSDANRLERNLLVMYQYIEANEANIPYCGQYIVGQEGVF